MIDPPCETNEGQSLALVSICVAPIHMAREDRMLRLTSTEVFRLYARNPYMPATKDPEAMTVDV